VILGAHVGLHALAVGGAAGENVAAGVVATWNRFYESLWAIINEKNQKAKI
jgi:hypothetical protein